MQTKEANQRVKTVVFDINRASIHDGPGIRTVVYLKGCNLRCLWCHNPEGLSPQSQIRFIESKCIGCGRCEGINKAPFYNLLCENVTALVERCPTLALSICGKEMEAKAVFKEVSKDREYYAEHTGGITISGGEPLLHPEFVGELLMLCKASGIHTCIETALFVPSENINFVLPFVDLFIADLKCVDAVLHQRCTRQLNSLILDNLKFLAERHSNIWVRTPLVPGLTDTHENRNAISKFVKELGENVRKHEFLDFNPLYSSKDKYFNIKRDAIATVVSSVGKR